MYTDLGRPGDTFAVAGDRAIRVINYAIIDGNKHLRIHLFIICLIHTIGAAHDPRFCIHCIYLNFEPCIFLSESLNFFRSATDKEEMRAQWLEARPALVDVSTIYMNTYLMLLFA